MNNDADDSKLNKDNELDASDFASKSARKREMAALQELGTSLIDLPARHFADLPIGKPLRDALTLAKTLKSREARRRQIQYIGKLMRAENIDDIRQFLSRLEDDNKLFRQRFRQIEHLCESLVTSGDAAIEPLIAEHPELNRQKLRQLARKAGKEAIENSPTRRKLFEYLQKTLSFN